MYTTVQIGTAGEHVVNNWLTQNGYKTNLDTKLPGSTDIEATSTQTSLLVQVKSAMNPSAPSSLSSDEMRNIKSRAKRLGYQAWEAKVTLNSHLQTISQIQWRRLDAQ